MTSAATRFRIVPALLLIAFAFGVSPLEAQTAPKPAAPQPKTPPKAPARPAARTPAPAPAAKAAEPAPPPKPVVQDLRMKTVYTAADQKTESVTYRKGDRERFEFGDVVLLKQHDLKRTVQIMKAANSYMVVPDGAPPAVPLPAAAPAPGAAPQKPGVVSMTTTIVDTGERKTAFGLQARHAKMAIDKLPSPGACDPVKQHIETDGWYVDLPMPAPRAPDVTPVQTAAGCVDEVKASQNGDPKVLGFPIGYSTTIVGDDGKPNVVSMEITELEVTNLSPALFDIPPGMTEAGSIQALTRAVSDASETKLAEELTAAAPAVQKTPGVALVGVPEIVNKTTQQIDTRELRARMVSELAAAKLNAAPLAGSQADIAQVAGAHGYDYVLVAEVTELKVSKGGGIGGMLKTASKVTGGGSAQDPTEAVVTIKLVQPDGKARFTTTAKGKDGGFDMKAGLGMAKFAGNMYMNVMTGKMIMGGLSQSMMGNLGGMAMLGNPATMNLQAQGLGMKGGMPMGMGLGIDPTAGAASFLMQQSMAGSAVLNGAPGQAGSSFDPALGEAFRNAARAVADNLKKAEPKKK